MNNKGFAISGILYAILVLFLMLLLLILSNFQARKVIFDKQKGTVLEKLEGKEHKSFIKEWCQNDLQINLEKFEIPNDGTYKLEVYDYSDKYISGIVRLYQGLPLYIVSNSTISSIQTESDSTSTVLLKCNSTECYSYDDKKITNSDISINKLENISITKETTTCPTGYVKITRIGD